MTDIPSARDNERLDAGYTPVFDWAVHDFGPTGALVYGAIWRYCQMREGKCWASYSTLGEQLRLSKRTVMRYVNALRSAGKIVDLTPDRNGTVHEYVLPVTTSDQSGDRIAPVTLSPVTESPHTGDSVSPPPVTFCHPRDTIEDTNKKPSSPPPPAPRADPEVTAVVEQWESVVGREATGADCQKLREWLDEFGSKAVTYAVAQCHLYGAPKLAYVWRVLTSSGNNPPAKSRDAPVKYPQLGGGAILMPTSSGTGYDRHDGY
jgi:hypothetical protein